MIDFDNGRHNLTGAELIKSFSKDPVYRSRLPGTRKQEMDQGINYYSKFNFFKILKEKKNFNFNFREWWMKR